MMKICRKGNKSERRKGIDGAAERRKEEVNKGSRPSSAQGPAHLFIVFTQMVAQPGIPGLFKT